MPEVSVMPTPGPGSFPSGLGKKTPAFQENGHPTRGLSAAQNGTGSLYENMDAAEIKKAAIHYAKEAARPGPVSPSSLIKTAGLRYRQAEEYESKGEFKRALAYFYQAAMLAQMAIEAPGSGGQAIDDFFKSFNQDRLRRMEEKVKSLDKPLPHNVEEKKVKSPEKSLPQNDQITSIADRMKALQNNGLNITPKWTRNLQERPQTPPRSFSASIISPSPLNISHALKVSPPGSSAPSPRTLVSPSQLGPPSPSSSPALSPKADHSDPPDFTTSFPPIEEFDERPEFSLTSTPMIDTHSTMPNSESSSSPLSPSSPYTSFRPHPPIEQPPGPPVLQNGFTSSLPGSPKKSSVPMRLTSHSPSLLGSDVPVGKSLIPVKGTATPSELYDYIGDRRAVLLLDVRPRIDYEKEHIKTQAVVCIEPVDMLLGNVTIDSLEDTLALGPRPENHLFSNRDKFDIVVIYDESSITLGPDNYPLSILFRLVAGHSGRKLLRRAPMLLVGGIEAWKKEYPDLVQAGVTTSSFSNTSATHSSTQQPQMWIPQPSHSSTDGHHMNVSLDQFSAHRRTPAEVTYPMTLSSSQSLVHRPAVPSPISQARSFENLSSLNLPSAPYAPISYPLIPRRPPPLPPLPSANGGIPVISPIISPPLASVGPSHLSRKRSDYLDPSQEALSGFPRASVDYPRLSASQVPRPPPAAASTVVRERQDVRYNPFISNTDVLRISAQETIWLDWPHTRIPPKGLLNLGNTCWMNSIVQCLNVTTPFANFFLDGRWRAFVDPSKAKLTIAYAHLVNQMRNGSDQKHLVPSSFHDVVCHFMPHFERGKQHDSQEFLVRVLDRIDEDLKALMKPEPVMTRAGDNTPQTDRAATTSIVASCFQSECSSRLQCSTCETTSVTHEHSNFLQLTVPDIKDKNGVLPKVSIYACLEEFFREEIMEKENQWLCPKCKKNRIASKKVSMTRPPAVLILHLKRYTVAQDGWGERMIKNNVFVDFPLEELDLGRYVSPPTRSDGSVKALPFSSYKYRLYGVTNHCGSESLDRGHYTAFISSDGTWLRFSDTQVTGPINPRDVVSSEAYVLFYRRIKP